jgi:coenzyme F420-reducing hydrogenase delta subunit
MKVQKATSPNIIAFCCAQSAYQAADAAGFMRLSYPDNIRVIRVPCAGRIDVLHILEAFEKGVDGVLVLGCHEEACRHLLGNIRAKNRVQKAKSLLQEVGIDGRRVEMFTLAPNQGPRFATIASEMTERIKELDSMKPQG